MRVLLTGASGFLGQVILSHLRLLNYQLKTLGRGTFNDFEYDFSSGTPFELNDSFDLVIHCAGKAHSVPKTMIEKQTFFDVNVTGTQYLLGALEKADMCPKYFVFISTVAVYGTESGKFIDEESPLLAKDSYGLSKIKTEQIIQKWCELNNVICTILRLPLIAGPNPPGNLKAMINGIKKGFYVNISGGHPQKSIVLAEDIAKVIPKVAKIGGIYNLTDRRHPSFSELSFYIAKQLGKSKPRNIPGWLAGLMAKIGDIVGEKSPINSSKLEKITRDLTFDDQKAVAAFGWNPTPVLKGFKIK